jgi:hypothetical protein
MSLSTLLILRLSDLHLDNQKLSANLQDMMFRQSIGRLQASMLRQASRQVVATKREQFERSKLG